MFCSSFVGVVWWFCDLLGVFAGFAVSAGPLKGFKTTNLWLGLLRRLLKCDPKVSELAICQLLFLARGL